MEIVILPLCIGFNTQPPEGGWDHLMPRTLAMFGFNTQPPEGGWDRRAGGSKRGDTVSTHSRPKAAGRLVGRLFEGIRFQHTAARRRLGVFLP